MNIQCHIADTNFVQGERRPIRRQVRFEGEAGEQSTLFVLDPSGNALEFKAFADEAMIFAK